MDKLKHAERKLKTSLPQYLVDFISKLRNEDVLFGDEKWFFWTINDNPHDNDDNFIVESTLSFKEEWGIDGLVFATNGIGDYLLLLVDENNQFNSEIYVMMHEIAEIRLFASNWNDLIKNGPIDYFWNEEYIYKIDDNGNTIKGEFEIDPYFLHYELKSHIDDLIDERDETKLDEIIKGLNVLTNSDDDSHKSWAFNKFSDYYLRGFGYIKKDIVKALEYNQKSMDLNNHHAFSNRAAAYFAGIGVERDIEKALEFAMKANELSKSNIFASDFSGNLVEDCMKIWLNR